MSLADQARNIIRFATARSKYASDEARVAAYRERMAERNARDRAARAARGLQQHRVTPDEPPPAHVLLARAHARAPETLTAQVLGDPPPGRSALDHKRGVR